MSRIDSSRSSGDARRHNNAKRGIKRPPRERKGNLQRLEVNWKWCLSVAQVRNRKIVYQKYEKWIHINRSRQVSPFEKIIYLCESIMVPSMHLHFIWVSMHLARHNFLRLPPFYVVTRKTNPRPPALQSCALPTEPSLPSWRKINENNIQL